jgi:hypothetical protein
MQDVPQLGRMEQLPACTADRTSMMVRSICTLLLTLITSSGSVSAGQLSSLGDAARRAEEDRKTAPPRSFTERDLVDVEWIITRDGLQEYATARTEIGAIRRKSAVLNQRLFEASRNVRTLADLAPVLGADSSIVQVLSKNALTTREYLRREQALINATAWATRKQLPESLKSRPIRMQNVEFVRGNDRLMRDTAARYQKAEPSPPWFNAARFVEQP